MKNALLVALTTIAASLIAPTAYSHGSVVDGGEGCIIRMDFYSAHFSIFQPQTQAHREFCEDLPDVTESVFVLEYRHNSLREVPVDFRIIHNTSELGRFVRWQDVQAMGDLAPVTVFRQQVSPRTDGVLSVVHTFTEPGNYIGIVTAPHPTLEQVYHAVFPFRVGRPFWQQGYVLLSALAVLLMILYRLKKRRHKTAYRRLL